MAGASERIALITDSTSDLPVEIAQGNGILQVPLGITLGEQAYVDAAGARRLTLWFDHTQGCG